MFYFQSIQPMKSNRMFNVSRNYQWYGILLMVLLCVGLTVSCKKDDEQQPAPPTPKVKLATSTTLGTYLTDSIGNTLYFYTRDVTGASLCTSGCLNAWPIFYTSKLTQDVLGNGLLLSDFAEITTSTGAKQTTYKGWPLYYYAPSVNGVNVRENPGETKGEAVGTVWFVAKTDYTIMLANAQLVGNDGKNYKGDYTEGTGTTQYLTNGKGSTIYTFTADKKNTSTCTGGCLTSWPIFADELKSIPSTLDKTLFGFIQVGDKKQLTYRGWPLYYFSGDTKRGETKGVSVPTPGKWPVAVKDAPNAVPQ